MLRQQTYWYALAVFLTSRCHCCQNELYNIVCCYPCFACCFDCCVHVAILLIYAVLFQVKITAISWSWSSTWLVRRPMTISTWHQILSVTSCEVWSVHCVFCIIGVCLCYSKLFTADTQGSTLCPLKFYFDTHQLISFWQTCQIPYCGHSTQYSHLVVFA